MIGFALGVVATLLFIQNVRASNEIDNEPYLPSEIAFLRYQDSVIYKPEHLETPKKVLTNSSKVNVSFDPCSCVMGAKAWTGYNKPVGYARNWPVNTSTPLAGGVVVSNYSYAGHVDYIVGVDWETRMMWVRGANWTPCAVGERWMSMDDSNIIGYWYAQ